ncbi:MAG: hypothetical protein PHO94_09370 [Petrimonas sp.]|nr:hypothetical protein [Petrimonas sp.]
MLAIIKGDIVSSRKMSNPEKWLVPLKELFNEWGNERTQWELVWGDSFQLEVKHPEDTLRRALLIKALVKTILPEKASGKTSVIDVRMAIGIGDKTYTGNSISESNGEAFIFAGEKFEELEKEKRNLLIKSRWPDFDAEMNLCLRLASVFMDNWSVASAELVQMVLKNPGLTQSEIGQKLGIKQNSVSGRWKRANIDEMLAMEKMYSDKLKKLLP